MFGSMNLYGKIGGMTMISKEMLSELVDGLCGIGS